MHTDFVSTLVICYKSLCLQQLGVYVHIAVLAFQCKCYAAGLQLSQGMASWRLQSSSAAGWLWNTIFCTETMTSVAAIQRSETYFVKVKIINHWLDIPTHGTYIQRFRTRVLLLGEK